HTERMLGLSSSFKGTDKIVFSSSENYPQPKEYFVPSDISTAAFFIILSLLLNDSELKIKNVSLNPTRTGILDVLKRMGANIEIQHEQEAAGEPFGDLIIKSSQLKNVELPKEIIPNIIDEIPILSIA